jgi:hypothetical protein
MKDLQSWRNSDGIDFASCVERVMVATDCESRHGPNVILVSAVELLVGLVDWVRLLWEERLELIVRARSTSAGAGY